MAPDLRCVPPYPWSPLNSGSDKLSHKHIQISVTLGVFLESSGNFSDPESCFVFVVFAFSKAKQSFNNAENNKMKLSVDGAKLTGLRARTVLTIQLVWTLKFAFGPEKFPGLSRNGPPV